MAKAAKEAAARFVAPMQAFILALHQEHISDVVETVPFTATCGPVLAYFATTDFAMPDDTLAHVGDWPNPELIGDGNTDTMLRIVGMLIAYHTAVGYRAKGKFTSVNPKLIESLVHPATILRLQAKIYNVILSCIEEMPEDLCAKPAKAAASASKAAEEAAAAAAAKAAAAALKASEAAAAAKAAEDALQASASRGKPTGGRKKSSK